MQRFPELGARETRSVTTHHRQDLPDGEYGFVELYCNELGCDCRRVVIDVLRPETGWSKIWATIGYGWDDDDPELKGPYLDPINPQSKYSLALLDLFRMLIESPDYVDRLRRHYHIFKESIEKEHSRSVAPRKTVRDRRRRRRSYLR